jgi:hypothetical protein
MNIQHPKKIQCGLTVATRWLVVLVLAAAFFANAQSTDDSSPTTDFRSFEVIVQRNIFDPNRYPHTGSIRHRETYRGVPTFSLAGTMSYRKGMFAFFNGTSDVYQKALQTGGKIAGYTVTKITFEGAQIEADGKTINLKVGDAMRQNGSGWELSVAGQWTDESSSSMADSGSPGTNAAPGATSAPAPTISGDQSDVLKRLMEKRAQELK